MRSIGLGVLFFWALAAAFAVPMDGIPRGTSSPKSPFYTVADLIPEHHFYPVQEPDATDRRDPEAGKLLSEPAWSSRPIALLRKLHPIAAGGSQADAAHVSLSQQSSSATTPGHSTHFFSEPFTRPTWSSVFLTLDSQPVPWTPPLLPESQPSAGSYRIPVFREVPWNRQWGPYTLGKPMFSMQTYPLHIPAFKHLYDADGAIFEDFKNFLQNGRLVTSGTHFRPDPWVLDAIQERIWRHLTGKSIKSKFLRSDRSLREGEYLWAPVDASDTVDGGLDVPRDLFVNRMRPVISNRVRSYSTEAPNLFQMDVEVGGQIRKVLTLPVTQAFFVDHYPQLRDSQLWLFFEGIIHRSTRPFKESKHLALLGGTFLPDAAEESLRSEDIFLPAFHDFIEKHLEEGAGIHHGERRPSDPTSHISVPIIWGNDLTPFFHLDLSAALAAATEGLGQDSQISSSSIDKNI
ncbi:uncharacterized protein UTRI_10383 [Ustilago trichophora]|uniref:Uncharacterized protein n=1 Tax=Ustilago trichophora TaxID=86804 RepID=A0A5C3ECF5_9BASI|nr:uncharacterized protein UTRI_10383 [Ustilago trichophora]